MRTTRLILCLLSAVMLLASTGCHMAEAISRDIEDMSAYTGQKVAEGGENMADWLRDLSE